MDYEPHKGARQLSETISVSMESLVECLREVCSQLQMGSVMYDDDHFGDDKLRKLKGAVTRRSMDSACYCKVCEQRDAHAFSCAYSAFKQVSDKLIAAWATIGQMAEEHGEQTKELLGYRADFHASREHVIAFRYQLGKLLNLDPGDDAVHEIYSAVRELRERRLSEFRVKNKRERR